MRISDWSSDVCSSDLLNPSISFFVVCESEEEVNRLWESLSEKGKILMPINQYPWSPRYGWLQDRYGLSWQLSLGKLEDVGQKITPSLMYVGKDRKSTRLNSSH